jgi:hypothetical protein
MLGPKNHRNQELIPFLDGKSGGFFFGVGFQMLAIFFAALVG